MARQVANWRNYVRCFINRSDCSIDTSQYLPGRSSPERSGALTRKADKKQIYVVTASGSVVGGKSSKWLGGRKGVKIMPGDTINAIDSFLDRRHAHS